MAYYEGEIAPMGSGYNNGDNGMFAGGWGGLIGLIAVAALFGWGNGGFGFGGGNGGYGVDAAVQRGFDTSTIISKLDGINNGLCDGFYAVNSSLLTGFGNTQTAIMQNGYETRSAINDLGYRLQDCCCTLSRGQERLACDIERSTNAIVQSGAANTQRILDYLCNEKIEALRAENTLLTSQLSQNSQTNTIINALRPTPVPSFPASNLYGYYGQGYGYNNGCGCNG